MIGRMKPKENDWAAGYIGVAIYAAVAIVSFLIGQHQVGWFFLGFGAFAVVVGAGITIFGMTIDRLRRNRQQKDQ